MKNRILAILLVLSVLMSASVVASAQEAADPSAEFNVVKALGIFNEDVTAQTTVTRGAVLNVILNLYGYTTENSKPVQQYKDVPETHKYAAAVDAATQLGIISGTPEGNYHPDDNLNCDGAVKMLVCVMGYGQRAELTGGFTGGYYKAARDMKMNISGGDTLTYDDLAKMIYSILEANTVTVDAISADGTVSYIKGETLLERLDMIMLDGIFSANSLANIYGGTTCGRDAVIIDGEKLLTSINYDNYLGFRVHAYAVDNGSSMDLLYMEPYFTEYVKLYHNDIQNPESILSSLEVIADAGNKNKTYKLQKNPVILYNGTVSDVYSDAVLNLAAGSVTLIDNDDDNTYEIISISESEDFIFDTYSKITQIITDKTGKSANLSSSNVADSFVVVNTDGDVLMPEEILEWDVVSIYYDLPRTYNNKKIIKAVVSKDSIMGQVNAITEDAIEIDGTEYYISNYYKEGGSINKIILGQSGTFYLNPDGEICASKSDIIEEISKKTGILIKAREDGTLTKKVQFKIYTYEDEFIYPYAANKIEIDGEKYDGEKALEVLVNPERQLVRYMLDEEGFLTFLDTTERGVNESDNSLKKIRSIADGNIKWRSGFKSFINIYNVDQGTKTFSVPTNIDNDDDYQANINNFEEDKSYSLDIYVTDNPFVSFAIVVENLGSSNMTDSAMFLVESIRSGINDETGEEGRNVKLLGQSNTVDYFMPKDVYKKTPIECGDIVCISVKKVTEITAAKLIYDLSEDKFFSDVNPSAPFAANQRVAMGTVYEKHGAWFSMSFDDPKTVTDASSLENRNLDYYRKYVYDKTLKKARIADKSDLVDYVSATDSASKVVVSDAAAWPKVCIIYN